MYICDENEIQSHQESWPSPKKQNKMRPQRTLDRKHWIDIIIEYQYIWICVSNDNKQSLNFATSRAIESEWSTVYCVMCMHYIRHQYIYRSLFCLVNSVYKLSRSLNIYIKVLQWKPLSIRVFEISHCIFNSKWQFNYSNFRLWNNKIPNLTDDLTGWYMKWHHHRSYLIWLLFIIII